MFNSSFRKRRQKGTPHFLFKKKKQKAGGQSLLFISRRFHLLPHPERKIKTHEVASCSTRASLRSVKQQQIKR
jgi:hypothetical protein